MIRYLDLLIFITAVADTLAIGGLLYVIFFTE